MGDRRPEVVLFTDGGCTTQHPSKPGGWAAILMAVADRLAVPLAPLIDPRTGRPAVEELSGRARGTTSNRMEMEGVIHGLRRITRAGTTILVVADSEYVVETMQGKKRRVKNLDLWVELDAVAAGHDVRWEHTNGHGAGDHDYSRWNSRAHALVTMERKKATKATEEADAAHCGEGGSV